METRSRASRRSTSHGRRSETADQRLDRLIELELGAKKRVSSVQPAVRSVRMEEGHEAGGVENPDARDLGETLRMGGLSSDQQQWLMQAAEQMRAGGVRRPDFLPAPLPVEDRGAARGAHGDVSGLREGEVSGARGGDLLGVLNTPLPGFSGADGSEYRSVAGGLVTSLFQGGASGGVRREEMRSQEPVPVERSVMGGNGVNPFWSEQVQKNVLGPGVGDSQRAWQQGAMSPDVGSTSGGPQHYVIHGGLSQRDVEEIDEMRRRATMELEERLLIRGDRSLSPGLIDLRRQGSRRVCRLRLLALLMVFVVELDLLFYQVESLQG